MPSLVGGFGNYFLPIHVGSPDYFKNLNKLIPSYYLIVNNKNYYRYNYSSLTISRNTCKSEGKDKNKDNIYKFNFLGPYLAGLFEGDGHLNLFKIYSNGNKSYPYIAITFVKKDFPLITKLLELFGGRLRFKIKENAIV
jgi:hypothetical protein